MPFYLLLNVRTFGVNYKHIVALTTPVFCLFYHSRLLVPFLAIRRMNAHGMDMFSRYPATCCLRFCCRSSGLSFRLSVMYRGFYRCEETFTRTILSDVPANYCTFYLRNDLVNTITKSSIMYFISMTCQINLTDSNSHKFLTSTLKFQ
ncbi:hypothetical protein CS542_09215 [Pedobacter sp. IW39]|nr:hypothetical protein CS542_09215 [Pedobacter sp. IW39]